MKKFKKIAGLVLFLSLGIVMFVMISYMLRPRINGAYRKKFTGFYEEEKDSLDVVALGSSAIYRYLDNPLLWEKYQLTSYNLATGAQPIHVLENLVDEVQKTQSPQLFIVETRSFLEEEDSQVNEIALRRVTDNMNYSLNRIDLINKTVPDWSDRITYYFDIAYYHDNWELLDFSAISYMDNKESAALNGWTNIFTVKEIKLRELKDVKEELPIPAASEKILLSFLEKCKKEGIQVLFVATPWGIKEDEIKKNNYIAGIVEENGFQFLDCNLYYEEIGLDAETDFYNRRHANVWGARKFTEFLAEYIRENYELESSHKESVIEEWNAIAEKNKAKMEKANTSVAE